MEYGEATYDVAVMTKDYCFVNCEERLEMVKKAKEEGHSMTTMPSDYEAFCITLIEVHIWKNHITLWCSSSR